MRNALLVITISILTLSGCNAQQNVEFTDEESVLDFYRQYSVYTDPGEYEYLYKNLPDSLSELCQLVRSQFLHIVAEYPSYKHKMPSDRCYDINKYTSVKSILEGLQHYDSTGLTLNRKPEDRLVLGCQNYALLFASILKYQGVPVRVRYGHATYLIPDFHTSHVICEVWNKSEKRWMLVDPNLNMVDFNANKFDISNEVWLQMQKSEIDPNQYGFPGKYAGQGSIVGKIFADLASILGTEYPLTMYPPIMENYIKGEKQLPEEYIGTLDNICELMQSLNADNLSKLQRIYKNTPEIQVTKTRDLKYLTEEDAVPKEDTTVKKPVIEFVDIPGGTFLMGSPEAEVGRKGDEVQHEVTVSAFKMSKYTITREQYELFIKATGRIMKYYRPVGGDKHPAMWVTWYDANAFAEWMGCRLPTEAEYEYAARANTTTPFYTGENLTSDQAYFNHKLIRSPMPVGSFPPNAFGLYDMHGNMVEWCSDWYGEYNINDKTNPKGPETGDIKVFRGGGFWLPAANSRSACRGGDPPINRGNGLSFRIVKDN
ncbi:SUMF1/EgtB/PvdO family nonheme iron enzyme [Candidatus Peregrinibacteria bacterium]|nr:SUMF1/EgtB/PvdO family nonheme iron enzyme [Candidatus Peregrinibacteria bacterium]